MFENVQFGPPDPMYDLKNSADADLSPGKADLGVGIYRSEQGQYSELRCVQQVGHPQLKVARYLIRLTLLYIRQSNIY